MPLNEILSSAIMVLKYPFPHLPPEGLVLVLHGVELPVEVLLPVLDQRHLGQHLVHLRPPV